MSESIPECMHYKETEYIRKIECWHVYFRVEIRSNEINLDFKPTSFENARVLAASFSVGLV